MANHLDLLDAFTSYNGCQNILQNIMSYTDPTVAVLALDNLYRIENQVGSNQFPYPHVVRNFLREWRCNSWLTGAYSGAFKRVPKILKGLTIFKTLEVPLFIDDYGKKELLSNYGWGIEDIRIDGSTPIYHVTHYEQAQNIVDERRFKPSDKNIIDGCWFGLNDSSSVYGSRSFATTLSKLGVTGLHQGEIVSYRQEVNAILYAADDTDSSFLNLVTPTYEAAQLSLNNPRAYATVSIFVPSRFLPSQEKFWKVFSGPYEVEHGPFCVKEKRSGAPSYECKELSCD